MTPSMMRMAVALLIFTIGTGASAADFVEIMLEPGAQGPLVARVTLDTPVRFVNRTNIQIHVEFIGDQGEHNVVNVPGRISAVFHRAGRHPFVVHAAKTGIELARGVVDVSEDPARNGSPVCGWITVDGICFER